MFDMTGHSIEFTGCPMPGSDDMESLARTPGLHDEAGIAMVCWGEDLARVPLIVWQRSGYIAFRATELTSEHYSRLKDAGEKINSVISEENSAYLATFDADDVGKSDGLGG